MGAAAKTHLVAFRLTGSQYETLARMGNPNQVARRMVTRWLPEVDKIVPGEDPGRDE